MMTQMNKCKKASEQNAVKKTTGRRQTSWIFTSVTEELNSGLLRTTTVKPQPRDSKFRALTTRPRWIPLSLVTGKEVQYTNNLQDKATTAFLRQGLIKSNQSIFSLDNINTLPSRKVRRIKTLIHHWMLSWRNTQFSEVTFERNL